MSALNVSSITLVFLSSSHKVKNEYRYHAEVRMWPNFITTVPSCRGWGNRGLTSKSTEGVTPSRLKPEASCTQIQDVIVTPTRSACAQNKTQHKCDTYILYGIVVRLRKMCWLPLFLQPQSVTQPANDSKLYAYEIKYRMGWNYGSEEVQLDYFPCFITNGMLQCQCFP